MAKISTRDRNIANAVSIPTGQYALIRIDGPNEGRIARVYVKQVASGSGGGTAVAFTVDLLNRDFLSPNGPLPGGYVTSAAALPADLGINGIRDQYSVSSGQTVEEYSAKLGGDGYAYSNRDSVNPRAFFALLKPTSSPDTSKWIYGFTIIEDIG